MCFKKLHTTTERTCKLASEVDETDFFATMAEHQKRSHWHATEADGSSHEMVLRTFDRNGVAKYSSKSGSRSRVKACEVEQIGRRLTILEEDTRAMKKALFDSLEERKNLVYEINQQFQIINKSHELCNEVAALMASLEDHDETLHSPKVK